MQSFQRLLLFIGRLVPLAIFIGITNYQCPDACAATPESGGGRAVLADRLVAQINAVAYTQWQVESYLLVKECLRSAPTSTGGPSAEPTLPDAGRWKQAVESFLTDMLVYQEAERIGSFVPPARMVDQVRSMFVAVRDGHPAAKEVWSRLAMTDASLGRAIALVLRVDGFSQSQERVTREAANAKTAPVPLGDRPWVRELRDRAVIRLFREALEWREIRFAPGGGS
jgi:hypothetical protein